MKPCAAGWTSVRKPSGSPSERAASSGPPEASRQDQSRRIVSHADSPFLHFSALNAHDMGGHRIEHFIAEHDAGKNGRQAIEPGHALEQVRHSRRERVPASLAKIGRKLEDEIVARHCPGALQLFEQRRGECAAPRA